MRQEWRENVYEGEEVRAEEGSGHKREDGGTSCGV